MEHAGLVGHFPAELLQPSGVDHRHDFVPVHERGHDHGVDHVQDSRRARQARAGWEPQRDDHDGGQPLSKTHAKVG